MPERNDIVRERLVVKKMFLYAMKKCRIPLVAVLIFLNGFLLQAQTRLMIDFSQPTNPVSPAIFGKNHSLPSDPQSADWAMLRDAGVRFVRANGGNNCTKYNWRRKLTSHPDWYNNVYGADWTKSVQQLQQLLPTVESMWGFQLIGKAAMTSAKNFDDWSYNQAQWWSGVEQNLAGGGVPNKSGGSKAQTEGNAALYLEDWGADSTTLILDNWFVQNKLNAATARYWNMDNEPEIWNGTHDDVMPTQPTAEQFMQRYFAVAKLARAKLPAIKLVGPVPANEWQWYNWSGGITVGGRNYSWLEFFIKRIGEEQAATGVRLLDVLDLHFYPGSTNATDVVQYHRVFFDKTYDFPEANGVKNVTGQWDNTQTKEYVFERCKTWLNQYLGANHGVTFGVTETGIAIQDANINAVWYGGMLGEFMKHQEVEIFSPWTWQPGMWETIHLFSRYSKSTFVPTSSTQDNLVSAYPSRNTAGDSLSVILINRSSATQPAVVSFNGYTLAQESFPQKQIANLPSVETFVSHTVNALKVSSVNAVNNTLELSLPALSITLLQVKGSPANAITRIQNEPHPAIHAFPNPVEHGSPLHISLGHSGMAELELMDINGQVLLHVSENVSVGNEVIDVDMRGINPGFYVMIATVNGERSYTKLLVR